MLSNNLAAWKNGRKTDSQGLDVSMVGFKSGSCDT